MPERGLSVRVGRSQVGRPQKGGLEVLHDKEEK